MTIDRNALISELGLTVESVFVPFSQSRNKGEKHPSLNWRVTIKRNGRDVVTTDYMAGCGHCPAYKADSKTLGGRYSLMRDGYIRWECEHGFKAAYNMQVMMSDRKHPLEPGTLDVLNSLVMDSDVLDAGGFEQWASDLGYDTDSRNAESIYRACLDIALKMRAGLGDAGLQSLRNAFEGY
jgi:hypothetical protein